MSRSNDLRKMCELPDNGALGALARLELPNIANDLDAYIALLERCRDALRQARILGRFEGTGFLLADLNERLGEK